MSLPLYIDEDSMDRDLVRALRARGIDVTTALEAGMTARTDADQLDFATAQRRVLYTFNVGDFCRLHSEYLSAGKIHAGIVVSQQQHYSVGEQMRRLARLLYERTAAQMTNRLEFLSNWSG